jgi:hypothetical protein
MSTRTRIGLVAVAVVVAVVVWASAQVTTRAQDIRAVPVDPPVVLSGSDVGFRIAAKKGDTPVGTLVVRVNGQWVAVQVGDTHLAVPGGGSIPR